MYRMSVRMELGSSARLLAALPFPRRVGAAITDAIVDAHCRESNR